MGEESVDDLLGPAHRESTDDAPPDPGVGLATTTAVTRPLDRKTKTWSRGPLTIVVVFEGGRVVARRVEGGEAGAR